MLGRMYDAIEYRGFAQDDRRGARRVRRRARLQRAHRRVPPDADPGRLPHDARALGQAARARSRSLPRRRPLQHGQLASSSAARSSAWTSASRAPRSLGRADELVAARARARGARPARGSRSPTTSTRRVKGADFLLHRRLGVDGRAGRGLGRADQAAHALPGQRRRRWRRPATRTSSSCTACPRSTTRTRRSARRSASKFGIDGDGGHRGGLRVAGVDRVRPGREPHAHDQGGARRHARRADGCASSSPSAATRCSGAASR